MNTRSFHHTFACIGLMSFGGPAAQIALMHRELVEKEGWLTEEQFAGALSFCMLLPGPEAMQLATYAGWRLRGLKGGLIAGLYFIGPGALVIYALAMLYLAHGAQPWAQAAFQGVKAAVILIVLSALWKLSKRSLKSVAAYAIAALSFLALFALTLPYPLIIALAALAGALAFRKDAPESAPPPPAHQPQTARLLGLGLPLWLAPLGLAVLLGAEFYLQLGRYFAQLSVLSFGGAYALLGWMTQTLVQDYGWLTTNQMIDALGLAETTPGPLILVTQFAGHLAGFGHGGAGPALLAGALVLWMVFLPCFLFIFVGAPYLERLLAMPRLAAALRGVSAAVTGVIASLALWFALSVLWPTGKPDFSALALFVAASLLYRLTRGNLFALIAGSAALGWLINAFLPL